MATKPNYIALINAFWKRYRAERLHQSVAALYLYILDCINRNRWEPVHLTDRCLAQEGGFNKNTLTKIKRELVRLGLIRIETIGSCRGATNVSSG